MLDQATSVFVTDAQGSVLRVFGGEPPPGVLAALGTLRQDRPAAQKLAGGGMALSVPLAGGRWCLWCLEAVPPLNTLGALLGRVQALTAGLMGAGAALAPAPKADVQELTALAGALKAPLTKPLQLVQLLGEHLVGSGQAGGLVVFRLAGGQVKTLWGGDAALSRAADLLRNLIVQAMETRPEGGAGQRFTAEAEETAAPGPEAALILQRLGYKTLDLQWPPHEGEGYGALIFDAAEDPPPGLAAGLPALMQLMRPLRDPAKTRGLSRWLKPLGIAAGVALTVFLLWPVPARITLTGTAEPESARIAALSSDAVLEAMLIRIGDEVSEGQPVARFRSVQLAEQAAQERLNIAVEELNAQGALAKNDYGAVRLHESRQRLAEARLAETESRIALLTVTAPAAGRVVSALPPHVTGGSFPAGREVVRVQTGPGFLMVLTPSGVDARRLSVGMTGEAMFRGLTDRDYALEVISPPALVRDPQSGRDHMELVARLTAPDERLMAGLTGYARLEGEKAPRILGLGHYLIEYTRTRLWTYLGLHL